MTERVPSRRRVILGGVAAGAGLAVGTEAVAADRRITALEGYSASRIIEAALAVQGRAVEKLVLEYIAVFERVKPTSQETLTTNRDLARIQTRIDAVVGSIEFKQALVAALRPKQHGEKFEFEKSGNGLEAVDVRVLFYYSSRGRLGFGIDANGLWATGG